MRDITLDEVQGHIKRLKKNKATGPDEIPMETFKELNAESLQIVTEMLNIWWKDEAIDQEYLTATACLIYKKGNTALSESYRPISLLNSIYKINAKINQNRLSNELDVYLQKT